MEVGKEYNLNNIKEIKVTEDFLGLSKTIRRCQYDESFDECITRKYVDELKQTCKCLPFPIREVEKVTNEDFFDFNKLVTGSYFRIFV